MTNELIKLTYTKEMEKQDKLWETEEEDTVVMERLFKEIVKEAKEKGFTGYCDIYQGPGEAICEIFTTKEEYELSVSTMMDTLMVGYCKPLMEYLEKYLNTNLSKTKMDRYLFANMVVGEGSECLWREIVNDNSMFKQLMDDESDDLTETIARNLSKMTIDDLNRLSEKYYLGIEICNC